MSIGYNVGMVGNYNLPKLTGVLTRLPPAYHVLMDNSAGSQALAAAHRQHTFAWRRWPDDNVHKTTDPVAWVAEMAAYMPDKAVYLYAGNEPEYSAALASWTVAAIAAADRLGRALVVVNGGMGGPERADWFGPLRPILEALHASNRWRALVGLPLHMLGLHEYADFGNWRAPGYDPLKGETWLIGRCTWLADICAQLGLDMPPIWLTEHGMDSLQDRYHGWKAIPLTARQYADEQLIPMDDYYREQVRRGVLARLKKSIFTWTGSSGWDTFQVRDDDELHERLIIDQQQKAKAQMDNWQTGTITVKATTLRVRSGPGTTWPQIGTLTKTDGPVPAQIGAEATEGGYTWVHIKTPEIEGWAATARQGGDVYMTFTSTAQEPGEPPEPPVVEPPQEPGENLEDVLARVAALEAEQAANQERWQALTNGVRAGGVWFGELEDAIGDGISERA